MGDIGHRELVGPKARGLGLVDPWTAFDEARGTRRGYFPPDLRDIWELPPTVRVSVPADCPVREARMPLVDFWDDVLDTNFEIAALQFEDIQPLPSYDPFASDNPFDVTPIASVEIDAQRRARWLVGMMSVAEPTRRRQLKRYFEELFNTERSATIFRSLSALALEDLSADIIVAACELRLFWDADVRLRSRRSRNDAGVYLSSAELSWPRAARLCLLCDPVAPQDVVEETWYFQWLDLHYGDELYWSFIDFVESRLHLRARGYWEPADPWPRRTLSQDRQREWGMLPLGSPSRTGEMIRGYFDQVAPPSDD